MLSTLCYWIFRISIKRLNGANDFENYIMCSLGNANIDV